MAEEADARRTCIAIAMGERFVLGEGGYRTVPAVLCGKPSVLVVKATVPDGVIRGGACGTGHLAVVQGIVNEQAAKLNAAAPRPGAIPRSEYRPRGLHGWKAVSRG